MKKLLLILSALLCLWAMGAALAEADAWTVLIYM